MTIATSTATSLADLKAAATNKISVVYNASVWTWTVGDFTGQADDVNTVKADSTALSIGAWVRQSTRSITFRQSGTSSRLRTQEDKSRERRTLLDKIGSAADGTTSNRAAFLALLADGGGFVPRQTLPYAIDQQVVMPAGSNLIFEDGAQVKWTGSTTNGAFMPVFVVQDGCSFGAPKGEVLVLLDAPDRYRYAIFATGVRDITLRGVRTRNMQRLFCNAAGGTYAEVVTSGAGANICRNIRSFGGGSSYDSPLTGSQSNASDYISYTVGWRIEDADHRNGTSGIQWWGGDANPAVDGDRTSERKCRDGIVLNSSVDTVLGAGIWGSMGQNITVTNCRLQNCGDVGYDAEGCVSIVWDRCHGYNCNNGIYSEFFHSEDITAINCTAVAVNGQAAYRFQSGPGYSNGTQILGGKFANSGTGVALITSAYGNVQNLKIDGLSALDVAVDMTYNSNQNLSFNISQRFTKPIGLTAFRAGRTNKLGTATGSLIITGSITTDVAQSAIAMQIDQIDAVTPAPLTQIKGLSISDGWTHGLVTAGSSGHFTIIASTIGSGNILRIGSSQGHTVDGVYNWSGTAIT